MGTNNLATIGASIQRAVGNQLDQYFTAITGVFVPRNTAGVPETDTQDLGSTTYRWRSVFFKILNVDKIKIEDNEISTTFTDSDLKLTPNGTGKVVVTDANMPVYHCRAWCYVDGDDYDGVTGICVIKGSGNVTSVKRESAGTYTITLTTAMPDTNYCIVGAGNTTNRNASFRPVSTTTFTCNIRDTENTARSDQFHFAVFR